ncbi:cyclic nucleotide-dependent protein kinase [Babesia gibsoni]|uniref:Cyclic nucleotide-dependent protein kinase n=1 Tax=Babesia gibsoni TaxID=33632 RepID=A0AAD8LMD7_BABGI|nr:cyclic nucleotide-dependent protein kinase [Babesia gibsoni]
MGATYSVADGVFDDTNVVKKGNHRTDLPDYKVRQWVKGNNNAGKSSLIIRVVTKFDKIAGCLACNANNTKDVDNKRVWSGNDVIKAASTTALSSIPDNLTLSRFRVGPTVGTGSYATVCLVSLKDQTEGECIPFALKVLHKSSVIKERQVIHVRNERQILSTIKHPFIVNYLGSFQDDLNIYMLLEYVCGGELFSYIYKYGTLGYAVAKFYTAEAVLAIDFLHSKSIVYRDLKPENMLLDMYGHIRLVDFGFAKKIRDRTYTVCGTHDYLAPEIFLRSGHGIEADWWSLGILVYELLMGAPPFHSRDPFLTYDLALENKIRFPLSVRHEVKDFIKRLLVVNPQKRLGSANHADIYAHKFFGSIDWVKMLSKQVKPPIVPKVSGIMDTSNYMHYPDVWRLHKDTITAEQQEEYFCDF